MSMPMTPPSEPPPLPPMSGYSEFSRNFSGMMADTQITTDTGFKVRIDKMLTNAFQVTHNLNINQPNPMFGMMPGAQPTKPSHANYGFMYMSIDEARQELIHQIMINFDKVAVGKNFFSDSEFTCQGVRLFKMPRKDQQFRVRWSGSQAPAGPTGGSSLCDELTMTYADPNLSAEFTAARPQFLTKSGPTLQGVFIASMLAKLPDAKWWSNVEADVHGRMSNKTPLAGGAMVQVRRMQGQFGGLQTSITPQAGFQYTWKDRKITAQEKKPRSSTGKFSDASTELISTAKTGVFLDLPFLGGNAGLNLQHYSKGGPKTSPTELHAELSIGQDPLPPQMGGTGGLKVSGSISQRMQILDPRLPAVKVGMPPHPSTCEVRSKLTTEGEVSMSVEAQLQPLPLRAAMKWTYDLMKDTMKIGAGISLGGQ